MIFIKKGHKEYYISSLSMKYATTFNMIIQPSKMEFDVFHTHIINNDHMTITLNNFTTSKKPQRTCHSFGLHTSFQCQCNAYNKEPWPSQNFNAKPIYHPPYH